MGLTVRVAQEMRNERPIAHGVLSLSVVLSEGEQRGWQRLRTGRTPLSRQLRMCLCHMVCALPNTYMRDAHAWAMGLRSALCRILGPKRGTEDR